MHDRRSHGHGSPHPIGLKVQALTNNPARAESDWHDIRLLVRAAAGSARALDWQLIADYLALFEMSQRLAELQNLTDGATE